MSILAKKYDITNASDQSEDIDELFRDIYEQLRISVLGTSLGPSGSVIRSNGTAPVWSTLLFPNAAVTGDLVYASATNTLSLLPDVATGNALISGGVGVAPSWGKINLATAVTGVLLLANGGTGLSSYTQGDLLYFNTGTLLSKLAKNTTATRYLSNTGASNNPAWAQVNVADGVTGVLPYANLTNATTNSLLLGRGSAGGGGVWQEITLGSNLLMTGTVLSATGGGGGTGNITSTGAFGSEPGSPASGDLYFPNNGFSVERHNGATWVPWGPLFPFIAPIDANYAWINQGAASVDTTFGGIYLSAPAEAGLHYHIRKKAAPATPYTITVAILLDPGGVDFHQCGLVFRESGSGKLVDVTVQRNTGATIIGASKYNSPTSFNATYVTMAFQPGRMAWLRIADNGANRISSYSADGQHWEVLHTVGRTDFLTADEVGFFLDVDNATWGMGITLLHWKEA